jgi:hypothetical protein
MRNRERSAPDAFRITPDCREGYWPWTLSEAPVMSEKDAKALSFASARETVLLPTYKDCLAHYAALRDPS